MKTRISPDKFAALLVAALWLSGCAGSATPSCPVGSGAPMRVFELFFGESIPHRSDLTEAEWARFTEDTITPALPDGFTVLDGAGQWRDPADGKIGREKTKIVLVALPDTAASLATISASRQRYQQQFAQESVGLVSTAGCASFD